MPVTIRQATIGFKDENGNYIRTNSLVEQTTNDQISSIQQAGASQVAAVQSEGSTAVGSVQSEAAAQITAIENKGTETLASIPNEYTELSNEVNDLKSAVFENTNSVALWQEGYYGASAGAYSGKTASAPFCCLTDQLGEDVYKVICPSTYKVRLHAWNGATYVGIWTGSAFSTSATYFDQLNIKTIRADFPAYTFKLVIVNKTSTTTDVPLSDMSQIVLLSDGISIVSERIDLANAKLDTEEIITSKQFEYTSIEANGIDASNGKNATTTARIRTAGFIPVVERDTIYISYDTTVSTDVYAKVFFYSDDDLTINCLPDPSDWILSGSAVNVPTSGKYCRISFKKGSAGTASMSTSDIDCLLIVQKVSSSIAQERDNIDNVNKYICASIKAISGGIDSNGKQISSTTRLISDGFIPVRAGQTVNVGWDSDFTLQITASYYTADDYSISKSGTSGWLVKGKPITIPSDVSYMRLIWRIGSTGTDTLTENDISDVNVYPLAVPDVAKYITKNTQQFAVSGLFGRQNLDLRYVGQIAMSSAFCRYNGKWYSTDGSKITVQANDLTVEDEATISLGHGNAMHTGILHPEYAYVSGWNDQTVYVVDLETLTIVDTIALPTTGYTTCAIDDLNKTAYIFQRDTTPSTDEHYNFIVYDYENARIVFTRKTERAFSAMQACDIWRDKIIVVSGGGSGSGKFNYYIVYDRNGSIQQEIYIPTLAVYEPEGVVIDREGNGLWIGFLSSSKQNLYNITRHELV